MGFSSGSLQNYLSLAEGGHLRSGASVLDFGSQNIFGTIEPALVVRFLDKFSSAANYHPDIGMPGKKLDALMRAAGFHYTAFDVFESGCTQRFDLNTDSLP